MFPLQRFVRTVGFFSVMACMAIVTIPDAAAQRGGPPPVPVPTPDTDELVIGPTVAISSPEDVLAHAAAKASDSDDPSPDVAGDLVLWDRVSVSLRGEVADVYDPLLGGDGSDQNVTVWFDSGHDLWTYGLGLTYDHYRVADRYDIDSESYLADLYLMYNVVDNLHIGAFVNLTYTQLDDATFQFQGAQVQVGDKNTYYGAGVMAAYTYTYQDYTFGVNSTVASMLKDDVGDLFDGEESQWYTMGSVYRPLMPQLAVEGFVGWSYYFERRAGRDEAFGNLGVNLIYTLDSHWSANIGIETDFAQDNYEARLMNASVTYDF